VLLAGSVSETKLESSDDDKQVVELSIDHVLESYIKTDPLCCRLLLYYFLDVAKKRETYVSDRRVFYLNQQNLIYVIRTYRFETGILQKTIASCVNCHIAYRTW